MSAWLTKHSQNPSRDAKIVAYYRAGLSLRAISAIFAISHERVRQIIASYEASSQLKLERNYARGERTKRITWRCAGCDLERKMCASQAKHRQICSKCNGLGKVKYSNETISTWIAKRRNGKTWLEIALEAGFNRNSSSSVCRIVYGFLRRNNRLAEVAELWQGYSIRYLARDYPKDFWLKEDLDDGRRTRGERERKQRELNLI